MRVSVDGTASEFGEFFTGIRERLDFMKPHSETTLEFEIKPDDTQPEGTRGHSPNSLRRALERSLDGIEIRGATFDVTFTYLYTLGDEDLDSARRAVEGARGLFSAFVITANGERFVAKRLPLGKVAYLDDTNADWHTGCEEEYGTGNAKSAMVALEAGSSVPGDVVYHFARRFHGVGQGIAVRIDDADLLDAFLDGLRAGRIYQMAGILK